MSHPTDKAKIMGCFDTYKFICPWCNKKTTDQVKPGYMNTYTFGEDLDQDIEMRGTYTCEHCDYDFSVDFETVPKISVIRLVGVEDEDI